MAALGSRQEILLHENRQERLVAGELWHLRPDSATKDNLSLLPIKTSTRYAATYISAISESNRIVVNWK